MKWKQTLSQFGLTEETISHGLRTKIKDYYSIQEGIDELKESIANPTINDDVEELQDDLQDLIEALETSDGKLVRAIEVFDKNKDKYAEMQKHLGKGRPRKDGNPPQVKQVVQSVATPQVATPQVQQVETPQVEGGEKKKMSLGWMAFALFAGIVTLGAVNVMKNRE
jgi:hypothetical protein